MQVKGVRLAQGFDDRHEKRLGDCSHILERRDERAYSSFVQVGLPLGAFGLGGVECRAERDEDRVWQGRSPSDKGLPDGLGQHLNAEGLPAAEMSKKSFMRVLAMSRMTMAWNVSAMVDSGM